ncbi:hypothetical protein FZEAL_10941 [Fusarium zealandicum]|uniref:Uncharacterized protein n=1 Tax=Fusarium zealandicum TaxID=1053134 RepID=A0A8H4TSN4_9HYPO|nr:hypothetical protein FZEAL_10941 [Fusarium zealandicum]
MCFGIFGSCFGFGSEPEYYESEKRGSSRRKSSSSRRESSSDYRDAPRRRHGTRSEEGMDAWAIPHKSPRRRFQNRTA